jgi:quercetin dioxygenase-like cupin family protein
MLGISSECGLILRGLHEALAAVGRDRMPAASLDAADSRPIHLPLSKLPDHIQPDREQVMAHLGSGERIEPQPGVVLETLVGKCNGARNLMTGIVTIQPESRLDYHTHPASEAITVLDGEVEVTVEGRLYRLGPLDNIAIPRWLPHEVRNPHPQWPARLHVAIAMTAPERHWVTRSFSQTVMRDLSEGVPGFERITRFRSARRDGSIGPNTEFIDYFNAKLMPGIEMTGGFGRFRPGGRLPAHLHDFDESISIVNGTATCLVEGHSYTLSGCGTALVPRGRVHYFINESPEPMDMIWVYAGPMPERIVVDAKFATKQQRNG